MKSEVKYEHLGFHFEGIFTDVVFEDGKPVSAKVDDMEIYMAPDLYTHAYAEYQNWHDARWVK